LVQKYQNKDYGLKFLLYLQEFLCNIKQFIIHLKYFIMSKISRRSFLQQGAVAAAAFTIAPSNILGKSHGYIAPSDKLNIACVGIGGMGNSNLDAVKNTENVVALCDVDWRYAKKVMDS
jgi:hypothetical protein